MFADLTGAARDQSAALLAHLQAQGVRATGLYRLRFVTHLDVNAAGVDRAVAAIRAVFPRLTGLLEFHAPCPTFTTSACSSPPACC